MTLQTFQQKAEPLSPDWFDETHDSVLILQSRECEENEHFTAPDAHYGLA